MKINFIRIQPAWLGVDDEQIESHVDGTVHGPPARTTRGDQNHLAKNPHVVLR